MVENRDYFSCTLPQDEALLDCTVAEVDFLMVMPHTAKGSGVLCVFLFCFQCASILCYLHGYMLSFGQLKFFPFIIGNFEVFMVYLLPDILHRALRMHLV